jgi:hypothetical protein
MYLNWIWIPLGFNRETNLKLDWNLFGILKLD